MPGVKITSVLGGPLARNDLTPDEYKRLIDGKGYRARWEKATFCPFRSPADPVAHDMNHTDCDLGFVYFDPKEVRVLMTGLSTRQNFMQTGRFDSGTAMATLKPENRVSFFDKLTLLDATMRFSELVKRAHVGVTDRLKYGAVRVIDVRSKEHGPFHQHVDYKLDKDGNIAWLAAGQSPAADAYYTISYEHHPVYVVMDLAHDIRDTMLMQKNQGYPKSAEEYAKLPVQAVVRLHFLERNQSKDDA